MKKVQLFEQFLNEAIKWEVDVIEPYSEKDEKKAASFKIVLDPITIKEVTGQIDDDYTELNIEYSNGDELYYENSFNGQTSIELTKGVDKTQVDLTKYFDRYAGSTGTVVGDVSILYRDYITEKIK